MTDAGPNATKDRFQAEFEALPLEEKFARLFKMEAATLSEAFTYAVNSSSKVAEKVGDAITDLGARFEQEVKRATEHCAATPSAEPKGSTTQPGKDKARTRKAPPKPPKT